MPKPRPRQPASSSGQPIDERYVSLEPRRLLAISVAFNPSTSVLSITGDSSADSAYVMNYAGNQVQVTGTGSSARYFNASPITRIEFLGYGGNDRFENQTGIVSHAYGHAGNDYLSGGSGIDILVGGIGNDELYGNQGNDTLRGSEHDDLMYGGEGNDYLAGFSGNDYLYGGAGNDGLYGQAGDDFVYGEEGNDAVRGNMGNDHLHGGDGNDYMMGDTENDWIYGGAGADIMHGWWGDDLLDGGEGDDSLFAHNGNDQCWGGLGSDLLRGGAGDDSLFGDGGNDRIFGENGNDLLRGGAGVDTLRGGNNNDSLHGGESATADNLYGEAGFDRFLTQAGDGVIDKAAEDAIVRFEDVTSQWTDLEIGVIDEGLAMLVAQTGNNALLRDSLDPLDLGFFKYEDLDGAAALNQLAIYEQQELNPATGQWETVGYDYERELHFADWDESSSWYNSQYALVAVHEIGHNWDSELELETISAGAGQLWNEFIGISDWRDENPNLPDSFTQSLAGNHWYLSSAVFAEDYGKTNPREDFATAWEYYFNPGADPGIAGGLTPKLAILTNLFSRLQS